MNSSFRGYQEQGSRGRLYVSPPSAEGENGPAPARRSHSDGNATLNIVFARAVELWIVMPKTGIWEPGSRPRLPGAIAIESMKVVVPLVA